MIQSIKILHIFRLLEVYNHLANSHRHILWNYMQDLMILLFCPVCLYNLSNNMSFSPI